MHHFVFSYLDNIAITMMKFIIFQNIAHPWGKINNKLIKIIKFFVAIISYFMN